MLFLNPWLLTALAGITIPVIIHLMRRQAAKPVQWGAMRFLMDTLSERRRRMEWEDLLLMAARCLLVALAALAVARPFIPPDSPTPWSFVLPAVLLGIGLFGGSFVLSTTRKRLLARAASIALLCLAAGMVVMEHWINLKRFETSGRRDVALVIDASTSMTRASGSQTLFDDALDEARRIVKDSPRGTSFAVILGGPSPQALSNNPVSHRADVLGQLDGLRPLGGTCRAHEALSVATLVLAEGTNANKDIIVLSDSQRHGWRFGDAGVWKSLADAWENLPAKPRLILRSFPQPAALRNAGIASLTTARSLTGTDRPALIKAEIENTGDQPVTPGELIIEVDGKPAAREALGLLVPGQSQTIETRHQFKSHGPHVVTARLAGNDEIPGDDRADLVVNVRKTVKVVLIDGNPAGSFFERAAGHTALALAPAAALVQGAEISDDFLMDPSVVPAPEVTPDSFAGADVVILADVSRLPATTAAALASHTATGAGLIVIAGPRSDPSFYNAWDGPDGPLLPLELGPESTDDDGIAPSPSTFRHEALAWAADPRHSDLGNTSIRRWRSATLRPGESQLAAAFTNGEPFIATSAYGHGRCTVATCAFDARSGNLPGRTAFLPFVHELTAWTAGGGVDWNVDPAWSPAVVLDARASGGLTAKYYSGDRTTGQPVLVRVDPAIHFNWSGKSPAPEVPTDHFTARWQGTIIPPVTGEYLIEAEADDSLEVRIDSNILIDNGSRADARIQLEAGKQLPFEASYAEGYGEASARLFWTPPGGTRSIIPSSAFLPETTEDGPAYSTIDPTGRTRKATVTTGRRGRELRINGPAVPGLYQVEMPAAEIESITGNPDNKTLPVVVRQDIAESRINALTNDDLTQLRARTDVIQPASLADVMAVLSGRGFGREITRTFAIAALILLLLETALARWVSRSRRAGDDLRVEFGDTSAPVLPTKGGRR